MSEVLKLYSVYDKKGDRYDTPFFALNDLHAERRFVAGMQDNKTVFAQFKNDFELHCVGEFNVLSGLLDQKCIETVIEGKQVAIQQKLFEKEVDR
jgi:hypothetical protein